MATGVNNRRGFVIYGDSGGCGGCGGCADSIQRQIQRINIIRCTRSQGSASHKGIIASCARQDISTNSERTLISSLSQ